MTYFCFLALCCVGDVAEPALPKGPSAANSLHYVDVTTEASPTNARGLQIVTVRLKIKPMLRVLPTKRGPELVIHDQALTMKLVATTRDPKTKVAVVYPIGHKEEAYTNYNEDEIAIQIFIRRAEGDRSPVQGQLDFRVSGGVF